MVAHFTHHQHASVIRQKGESQDGCFKKTKHTKFSEKRRFLTHCVYQGVRNVRFLKIWRALFSWNTRFEIRPFVLLPTHSAYQRLKCVLVVGHANLVGSSNFLDYIAIQGIINFYSLSHGGVEDLQFIFSFRSNKCEILLPYVKESKGKHLLFQS